MSADLHGTPAQVRWATDVRRKLLQECDRVLQDLARLRDGARTPEAEERFRDALRDGLQASDRLQAIDSASWWIDHRELTARQLLARASDGDL